MGYFGGLLVIDMCTGAHKAKGIRSPGARVTGSCEHLTWLLGIELGSSGGKVHALNH